MKHTPGPWVVYDDSNDGKTNRIEIAATGKTVARIYHSIPAEDLPNARLIAAAPEMYVLLKKLVERSDAFAAQHRVPVISEMTDAAQLLQHIEGQAA